MNQPMESNPADIQQGALRAVESYLDANRDGMQDARNDLDTFARANPQLTPGSREQAQLTNDLVQSGGLPKLIVDSLGSVPKMQKAGTIGYLWWSDAEIDKSEMQLLASGTGIEGYPAVDKATELSAGVVLSMMEKGFLPEAVTPDRLHSQFEEVGAIAAAQDALDSFKDGGWDIAAKGDANLTHAELDAALANPEGLTADQRQSLQRLQQYMYRFYRGQEGVSLDGLQEKVTNSPEAVETQRQLNEVTEAAFIDARTAERWAQMADVAFGADHAGEPPAAVQPVEPAAAPSGDPASADVAAAAGNRPAEEEPADADNAAAVEAGAGADDGEDEGSPTEHPAAVEAAAAAEAIERERVREQGILELLSQDTKVGRGEGFWHSASRLLGTEGGDELKGLTRMIKNYHEETTGQDFDHGAYLHQNQQLIDEALFARIKADYGSVYERYAQMYDAQHQQ